MNPSQHLLVLISMILGLGIREVLLGARNTLASKELMNDRYAYTTYILLAAMLFITLVQFWWFLFVVVQAGSWHTNFFSFLFTLARPILLFLAISSAFPPAEENGSSAYYLKNRLLVWLPLLLFEAINLLELTIYYGLSAVGAQIFHAIFIACALALAFAKSIRIHFWMLTFLLIAMIAFILIFSLSLT